VQAEFTEVDRWDLLDNPNDLKNEDEILIHKKLVKRKNVIIQAVFRQSKSFKQIVGIGEDLSWVYIRDYENSIRIACISMVESPKLLANISENLIYVTLQDNYTISVDLHTIREMNVLKKERYLRI